MVMLKSRHTIRSRIYLYTKLHFVYLLFISMCPGSAVWRCLYIFYYPELCILTVCILIPICKSAMFYTFSLKLIV